MKRKKGTKDRRKAFTERNNQNRKRKKNRNSAYRDENALKPFGPLPHNLFQVPTGKRTALAAFTVPLKVTDDIKLRVNGDTFRRAKRLDHSYGVKLIKAWRRPAPQREAVPVKILVHRYMVC